MFLNVIQYYLHVFLCSVFFILNIILWECIHDIYVAQIHSFIFVLSTPLNKYITIYFTIDVHLRFSPIVALSDNPAITILVNVSSSACNGIYRPGSGSAIVFGICNFTCCQIALEVIAPVYTPISSIEEFLLFFILAKMWH